MKILISNDDGIYSAGINALSSELSMVGEITVMAPDRDRSAASSSLTLSHPLRINKIKKDFYAVEGTPTDCVHLALTGYFDFNFDIVVSGINHGTNLGDDVWYSGTVSAAIEGRYLGLPAIAVSMAGKTSKNLQSGAIFTRQLLKELADKRLPAQTILNVNIPDLPLHQINGIEVTRLGTRHSSAPVIKDEDPRGKEIYWIGPAGLEADAGAGTDFNAISRGYISITPLKLDLTNYHMFNDLSKWMKDIEWEF